MHRDLIKHRKVVVFDFDGTVVNLKVKWQELKEYIMSRCIKYGLSEAENFSLNEMLMFLKRRNLNEYSSMLSIVRNYEIDGYKGDKNPVILNIIKSCEGTVKKAIFSGNCRETILSISRKLEVGYDCVIAREDIIESPKPSPYGLKIIMDIFRVKPEDMVFIGDSQIDYLSGLLAGIDTIIWRQSRECIGME